MSHTHPPQEILIKVMCNERFPSESETFYTSHGVLYYSDISACWYDHANFKCEPIYWYEPATRVVLTVEEYNYIQKKIDKYKRSILLRK